MYTYVVDIMHTCSVHACIVAKIDLWPCYLSVPVEVEQDKASLQNAPAKYSEPVCDGEKFSIKSGKFHKGSLHIN